MENNTKNLTTIIVSLLIAFLLIPIIFSTLTTRTDDINITTYVYRTSIFQFNSELNDSSKITYENETEESIEYMNIIFCFNPVYSNNSNTTYNQTRVFFASLYIPLNVNDSAYIRYENFTLRYIAISLNESIYVMYNGIDFNVNGLGGIESFDLYLITFNFFTDYIDLWFKIDGHYHAIHYSILT